MLVGASSAQENLIRQTSNTDAAKSFRVVKEIPITSVKNQYRSGTCWDYATLGFFESEIPMVRHSTKVENHTIW